MIGLFGESECSKVAKGVNRCCHQWPTAASFIQRRLWSLCNGGHAAVILTGIIQL
jgi:hypothetical protein